MKLMKKKKKGFTLIELIAVIAILAVLAVVAVPRVITYVDKSKKVAVQTEASTIYNTAEAAYNDGRLKSGDKAISAKDFDGLGVNAVVSELKGETGSNGESLLNNVNIDKLKAAKTLGDLKTIMNTNVNTLDVDSQGVLQTMPGTQAQK